MRTISLLAILATVLSLGLFLTACQEMATSPEEGGFLATATVTVEGNITEHSNSRDSGSIMANTVIKLLDSSDNIVGSDVSDSNGDYSITSSALSSTSGMSMLLIDDGTAYIDDIVGSLSSSSTNHLNIRYYTGIEIRIEQKEADLEP